MPILVWSEEYSVNVAEIDAQHKTLLEHVNKLHAGVMAKTPVHRSPMRSSMMRYVTEIENATSVRTSTALPSGHERTMMLRNAIAAMCTATVPTRSGRT